MPIETAPRKPVDAKQHWTDEIEALIHDPDFKEWFGDWEKENGDSSKIVDEDGRPRLVFFGNHSGIKELHGNERVNTGSDEIGSYSTFEPRAARFFAETMRDPVSDERIPSSLYCAFLNMRSPYTKQPGDGLETGRVTAIPEGYDGYVNPGKQELVVFDPGQIRIVGEMPVQRPAPNAPLSNMVGVESVEQ